MLEVACGIAERACGAPGYARAVHVGASDVEVRVARTGECLAHLSQMGGVLYPSGHPGALAAARLVVARAAVLSFWREEYYGAEEEPVLLLVAPPASIDPWHLFDATTQDIYYFERPTFGNRRTVLALARDTGILLDVYETEVA